MPQSSGFKLLPILPFSGVEDKEKKGKKIWWETEQVKIKQKSCSTSFAVLHILIHFVCCYWDCTHSFIFTRQSPLYPISYTSSMSLKLSQHSTASLRDVLLQVSAKVIPSLRQQVVLLHSPIQKQPSRPGLSLFPHHQQASCHCKLSRADPRERLSLCPAAAPGSYQPQDHAT